MNILVKKNLRLNCLNEVAIELYDFVFIPIRNADGSGYYVRFFLYSIYLIILFGIIAIKSPTIPMTVSRVP